LYDLHGNRFEWCRDWFDAYPGGMVVDPQGPSTGSYRVIRGGFWYLNAAHCRSVDRYYDTPASSFANYGFRVVLAAGQP
jgi:formylglycine-generating enzyme required for sulfatase activity